MEKTVRQYSGSACQLSDTSDAKRTQYDAAVEPVGGCTHTVYAMEYDVCYSCMPQSPTLLRGLFVTPPIESRTPTHTTAVCSAVLLTGAPLYSAVPPRPLPPKTHHVMSACRTGLEAWILMATILAFRRRTMASFVSPTATRIQSHGLYYRTSSCSSTTAQSLKHGEA